MEDCDVNARGFKIAVMKKTKESQENSKAVQGTQEYN